RGSRLSVIADQRAPMLHPLRAALAGCPWKRCVLGAIERPHTLVAADHAHSRQFRQGGGRVVAKAGTGGGCALAALKLDSLASIAGDALVDNIAKGDRIVAAALLETDQE